MITKKSNKQLQNYQQILLLFMALFILLSPCSVKSQLKDIVGLPTKTEYNSLNKTSTPTFIKSSETCLLTHEMTMDENSVLTTSKSYPILPVLLVALRLVCFITLRNYHQKTSSRYEKLSILPALPLFMQYRQLII